MQSLFGIEKPKAAAVVPETPPPPTVNAASERTASLDRTKFRLGSAANRLSNPAAPAGRVGIYKALGGGATS